MKLIIKINRSRYGYACLLYALSMYNVTDAENDEPYQHVKAYSPLLLIHPFSENSNIDFKIELVTEADSLFTLIFIKSKMCNLCYICLN